MSIRENTGVNRNGIKSMSRKLKVSGLLKIFLELRERIENNQRYQNLKGKYFAPLASERGDVPGWVLVVLMTTGLVTAIWTIAAPRLTAILKNSLDAMNGIR